MPHVDCLYNNVQTVNTDAIKINSSIEIFNNEITKLQNYEIMYQILLKVLRIYLI